MDPVFESQLPKVAVLEFGELTQLQFSESQLPKDSGS
jgi:hypothetical protein